jgi:hypothetical protein
MSQRIMVNGAILMFAKGLAEKTTGTKTGTGPLKNRIKILIPKNHRQLPELEKLFLVVATEKWGAKGPAVLKAIKANPNHCPLKDGDLKTEWGGFEGNFYVSSNTDKPPSMFDNNKNVITFDEGILYSGCKVNASLEFFPYDNESKGIGTSCRGVQFAGHGQRFEGGGTPASADEFGTVAVEDADDLA